MRLNPQVPARHYQTYQIAAPYSSHWRRTTCEEVACDMAERGWKMKLDLTTELGQRQARYIKHESGRKFSHENLGNGLVELTFSSGQECFQEHKVRLDRQERYLVKGGDHRGNPLGTAPRIHTKPEFWVEDFQENQEALKKIAEKG